MDNFTDSSSSWCSSQNNKMHLGRDIYIPQAKTLLRKKTRQFKIDRWGEGEVLEAAKLDKLGDFVQPQGFWDSKRIITASTI